MRIRTIVPVGAASVVLAAAAVTVPALATSANAAAATCGSNLTTTVAPAAAIRPALQALDATDPTTAPADPTTAPADPTTAPADPTTAPADPTTAPADPTTAPADPTTAPADPTTPPADPTTAPADPTTPPASPSPSQSTPPPAPTPQAAVLKVNSAPSSSIYGTALTVSGSLKTSGGTALPNCSVQISGSGITTTLSTTDGSGNFSATFKVPAKSATWTVQTVKLPTALLIAPKAVSYKVTEKNAVPTYKLSGFGQDEYGDVKFTLTPSSTNKRLPSKVYVQESRDRKTWKTIATYNPLANGKAVPITYNDGFWTDYPHGYLRVYSYATTGYNAAASNTETGTRYLTRVTGGKPSHTSVKKNTKIAFSGHVQYNSSGSTWKNVPSGTWAVLVYSKNKNLSGGVNKGQVKISKSGSYSFDVKATATGYWTVIWYTPNSHYIDMNGPITKVTVK